MAFPHEYRATATVATAGLVHLNADGLPEILSAPPKAFNGPGDQWSPEDLLVAAVADCFVLSFQAIAAMSKFNWNNLDCNVSGTLDKVERDIKFTNFTVHAKLNIPADSDEARAQRLLEKAKATCFVTNSLNADVQLETTIEKA